MIHYDMMRMIYRTDSARAYFKRAYNGNPKSIAIDWFESSEAKALQKKIDDDNHLFYCVWHNIFTLLRLHFATTANDNFEDLARHWDRICEEIVSNKVVDAIHAGLVLKGDANAYLKGLSRLHYVIGTFEVYGQRVYEITPTLGMELANTDVTGLKAGDLQLPYGSIYIEVPPSAEIKLKGIYRDEDNNKSIETHPINGIYVTEFTDLDGCHWWNLQFIEKRGMRHTYTQIPLYDGASLDSCVEAKLNAEYKRCIERGEPAELAGEWASVFYWVLNVVLYLMMPDADVEEYIKDPQARALWRRIVKLPKSSKKRRRLKARLSTLDTRRHIAVGRKIYSRVTIEKGRHDKGSKDKGSLKYRYIRRGHWRWQAYGPEWSLRRLTRIRPTWIGDPSLPVAPRMITKMVTPDEYLGIKPPKGN